MYTVNEDDKEEFEEDENNHDDDDEIEAEFDPAFEASDFQESDNELDFPESENQPGSTSSRADEASTSRPAVTTTSQATLSSGEVMTSALSADHRRSGSCEINSNVNDLPNIADAEKEIDLISKSIQEIEYKYKINKVENSQRTMNSIPPICMDGNKFKRFMTFNNLQNQAQILPTSFSNLNLNTIREEGEDEFDCHYNLK
jgi:hypothetical protein